CYDSCGQLSLASLAGHRCAISPRTFGSHMGHRPRRPSYCLKQAFLIRLRLNHSPLWEDGVDIMPIPLEQSVWMAMSPSTSPRSPKKGLSAVQELTQLGRLLCLAASKRIVLHFQKS